MAVAALTFDTHIHTPCPTPANILNSNNKHNIWNLLLYNVFSSERDSLYVQMYVLESGLNPDGLQIHVKEKIAVLLRFNLIWYNVIFISKFEMLQVDTT